MADQVMIRVDGRAMQAEKGRRLKDCLPVELPCGGHGKCGKCRVYARGALSSVCGEERALLSQRELDDGVRLACYAEILGECEIVTGAVGAQEKKIVCEGMMPEYVLRPAFGAFGAAVDIGTTTLAARLYDAQGRVLSEETALNPQTAWGADVISRIEAALKGQADALRRAVCGAVDALLEDMARKARIDVRAIDGAVITGNTAMLCLLTGEDISPMARAPFALPKRFGEAFSAERIGLAALKPETEVYLPACMSAFVGADVACAALAAQLCSGGETKLLADIGTNGEICLRHGETLYTASTAAGPAFEGVGISCGMRAETGAIDKVRAAGGRLEAHVIGGGEAKGICGSGLMDAVAGLLELELLDETGALEDEPAEIGGVSLTQKDIRMVQLAKGAVCAGIRTLLETAGVRSADSLIIAGGFGRYLNMDSAVKIGLIPPETAKQVMIAGNGALSGAALLLLDTAARSACLDMAERAKSVELSANPVFARHYMMCMAFDV